VQKLQTKPRARGEFTYFVVTGNYTQVSLWRLAGYINVCSNVSENILSCIKFL
jgi:hypothetical protein